jgi:predicted permease
MSTLLQDIRYALRVLAKSPGFSAVAVLILAVGIGANTAIFSVASSMLLRPLPYSQPGRLALVTIASASEHTRQIPMSWLRFTTLRDQNRSFSGLAGCTDETFNLSGLGEAEQLASARVTANFFDVLGVRPAIGRTLSPEEDQPGGRNVVLISHSLWMRKFGGAADVAGRHITLDSQDYTVIGVLPRNFGFQLLGTNIDLWAPRVFDLNLVTPQQIQGGTGFLTAVARLRPFVTREQAQAEIKALDRRYQSAYPGRPDVVPTRVLEVGNLQEEFVGKVRPAVLILAAAVGLLLLIACANLASLLLSRALGRGKEMAVRTALGAKRGAIIRQLLVESILLALAGGALGILLGRWGTALLLRLAQKRSGSRLRSRDGFSSARFHCRYFAGERRSLRVDARLTSLPAGSECATARGGPRHGRRRETSGAQSAGAGPSGPLDDSSHRRRPAHPKLHTP